MKYDCKAIDLFGERIKQRCKDLGLTYPALAKLVFPNDSPNVNEKTLEQNRKNICNYANGHYPKDPAIYLKLCNALDCDIEYLFGVIDFPRKEVLDASEITGLSENAINKLYFMKRLRMNDELEIISALLFDFLFSSSVHHAAKAISTHRPLYDDNQQTFPKDFDLLSLCDNELERRELQNKERAALYRLLSLDEIQRALSNAIETEVKNGKH